jgi:hypothetical protein
MADKVQNITINYKVNTSEVEKANATLNRANQATNQLQAAAEKSGQNMSKSFKQVEVTVGDLRGELNALRARIDRTAANSPQLAALTKQYADLNKQIQATTKTAGDAAKSSGSLATQFGNLYRAAQLFVTAGIAKEIVDVTLSMATLQGQVEGVSRGFERAFPNSVKVLGDLRQATKGTINDFELMKRTLQATNLGVSVEKLPILFEFAAARAQQTGESVDYLVDSIVRGIGRKSPLVLDNLGISVTALKEKFDGASIASKTVAEATEGVAEIAKEQLEKMGGYVATAETDVKNLKAAWQELRIEISKKIESGGIIGFLNEQIDNITTVVKGQRTLQIEYIKSAASADAARVTESESFKQLKGNQQARIDFIQQEVNSRVQLVGRYNDQMKAMREQRDLLKDKNPYDKQIESINNTIKALEANKFVILETKRILKEYLDDLSQPVDVKITNLAKLREDLAELKRIREEDIAITNTKAFEANAREINQLEQRILRIDDNIKYMKQFDMAKEQSALATANETAQLKLFNDEIDKFREKTLNGGTVKFSTGEITGDNSATESFGDLSAPPDLFDPEEIVGDSGETAAELLANKFWTRLRLAFKQEGGDTSELQDELNQAMETLFLGSVDIVADQLMSLADVEVQTLQRRLGALKEFYDMQLLMAGDNEKAKERLRIKEENETNRLRRRIFEADKKAAKTQALINGAAAIVKTLATVGYPAGIVLSALVAAQTASQIAIIDRQQARFAKGVIDLKGPGTGTSDSIPAKLSKGESVMTAWETKNAGGILRDIRARKLDDSIIKSLKVGRQPIAQNNFNDERIIKAIRDNKAPDIIEQSGIVYKVTQKSDEYRNRIRAKTIR